MSSISFYGTSNPQLFKNIDKQMKLAGKMEIARFSDGEVRVEIKENIRGNHVYLFQSTCNPVNDTLMELLIMSDAARRSSAQTITAVLPYFGYARQDRRVGYSRVPISARLVANMIQAAGINHLITLDLHATQIQGFFDIPVDNISATQLFVASIYKNWMAENPIIVSPDVGGVARARALAKQVNDCELAIVDKRRPKANVSEVMNIIGDVEDKTCIIVDDMVDTAGTLAKAADALIEVGGARRVVAYATHGVLSGKAKENLQSSKLEKLFITNTIPLQPEFVNFDKISVLNTASLISETVGRIINNQSISAILE